MTVKDLILRNARRYPDKIAIVFKENKYTFKQFNEKLNKLINALHSKGMKKGDRLGLLLDNCHQFLEVHGACSKSGIIFVPLNCMLKGGDLRYIINDSEITTLIFGENYIDIIKSIQNDLKSVKNYIYVAKNKISKIDNFEDYEKIILNYSSSEPNIELEEEDILYIGYTSGTTGKPKGAMISHKNAIANAINCILALDLVPGENVCLLALPLYFAAPINCQYVPIIYLGDTTVVMERFIPDELLKTIEREKVTFVEVVPIMIIRLLEYKDLHKYNISSLNTLMYGSAPMPVERLGEAINIFGKILVQGYGLTETTCLLTCLKKKDHFLDNTEEQVKRLGSAGKEVTNVEIKVVNEKGESVSLDEVGEIIARGDNVMKGYWRLPDEAKKTIRDGWIHVGDMAVVDKEGYITIVDRIHDMIISGGINIYPREIEEVIYTHSSVLEVAVIGVPDEAWGESVKALVVLKEGEKASEEEIIELCRKNLAGYKKPKSVEFIDSLPRTPSGKVLKRELREKYWKGYGRRVH